MLLPKRPNERRTPQERAYYAWLGQFPCCLTGRTEGVQIAHVGDVTTGKGTGYKAPYNQTLPLHWTLHAQEEAGRREFWANAISDHPIVWAERLYECRGDYLSAMCLLIDMKAKANRPYLEQIMRKHQ